MSLDDFDSDLLKAKEAIDRAPTVVLKYDEILGWFLADPAHSNLQPPYETLESLKNKKIKLVLVYEN